MKRESIFRLLVDHYKKRRQARKSRSRIRKYLDRTVCAIGIAWVFLMCFPNPLFAHSVDIGRFTVRSDRPIPDEIHAVIAKAESRLVTSPLLASDETFAVYIANDAWRMRLLYPTGTAGFGRSNLLTGNVILNRSDVAGDVCFRGDNSEAFSERSLSSVIAHECAHQLIRNRLGVIGAVRLPQWKNEGYCEYVADTTTIDPSLGHQMLAENRDADAPAFHYFTYYVAVRYLLDHEKMTIDELFQSDLDFQATLHAATVLNADGEP